MHTAKYILTAVPTNFSLAEHCLLGELLWLQVKQTVVQVAKLHEQNGQKWLLLSEYGQGGHPQNIKKLRANVTQTYHCFNSRIMGLQFVGKSCFILLKNQMELYFVHPLQEGIIKIVLDQIDLVEPACSLSPELICLYGHSPLQDTNVIQSLNLRTFQLKTICEGKKYSPGSRRGYFAMFSDDRLYVFGGTDGNQNCQQLFWIFDFSKGYWFALQLEGDITNEVYLSSLFCEYDPGKLLLIASKTYLVELYQSRVSIIGESKAGQAIGVFSHGGTMVLYNEKGMLPQGIKVERKRSDHLTK